MRVLPLLAAERRSVLKIDTVAHALTQIAAGRPVVVVDDPSRENEGDLVMAAQDATPEWMAFFVRYSTGIICAPMTGELCDRLELPAMHHVNQDRKGTAFTVSVDAGDGISTGVSAADRARTMRVLANPQTSPGMMTRPGHIFPLRARAGGVLARRGHTEATVDLLRLGGKHPVGAIAEIVRPDGAMMRLPDLIKFTRKHGLAIVSIADLAVYRRQHEPLVEEVSAAKLPTTHGEFQISVWRDQISGDEHVVLVAGDVTTRGPVPVRVHSECLTGDVFGSQRCDCGQQLEAALSKIADEGRGVVIYMGGHEGRGIGIADKIRAYALQDLGADTVDANLALGLPVDAREYHVAGQILRAMGVTQARLLTNNPQKRLSLSDYVEIVAREPLEIRPNEHNIGYLQTKQQRMNHALHV
jgi:3,4-dihydroxy 2-butanone 4-phosphate synthase / GTP cyclohydrolase II